MLLLLLLVHFYARGVISKSDFLEFRLDRIVLGFWIINLENQYFPGSRYRVIITVLKSMWNYSRNWRLQKTNIIKLIFIRKERSVRERAKSLRVCTRKRKFVRDNNTHSAFGNYLTSSPQRSPCLTWIRCIFYVLFCLYSVPSRLIRTCALILVSYA